MEVKKQLLGESREKQFNKEKQRKTKIFVFYFSLGDNVQPLPRK